MANKRLPMRKIREVLRLHHDCHLSQRAIRDACGLARSTVIEYIWRAKQARLSWPLPETLTDEDLERLLYPPVAVAPGTPGVMPDFAHIHSELISGKKFNLTLSQLWEEYRDENKEGYQYSRFCELFRRWLGSRDYCMRQEHKAGEKLFVDYGDGLDIWNTSNGEPIKTDLFVAVWGASNFTYVEASLTQDLAAWCEAHVRGLEYSGCAPHIAVPDNLKSAVTKPSYYEPEINRTYAELAGHYGFAVIPARPAHPRDKAKVETGVLIAKRWILAKLRHRTFYSLADLNAAIRVLLDALNDKPLRKLKRSRRELFLEIDHPAALPLPASPYEYAEWRKARVNLDYHIEADCHYYSVPFQLLREEVDVRLTANTAEIFHRGKRVAAHPRSRLRHKHTTLKEHMPPEHQKYLEWTPTRIIDWAGKTGPAAAAMVQQIMAAKTHPEQGYRSCLGIMRLGKSYGSARLEAACARALRFNVCSFGAVRSILSSGLDRQTADKPPAQPALPLHDNLRGDIYYRS